MAQRKRYQVPRHPADKPPLPKALNGGNLIQGRLGLTQRAKPRVKWPVGSKRNKEAAGRAVKELESALASKKPTGATPTEKEVAKAKELRSALQSGRAEAKPEAKLLDLGPPLRGLDIIQPNTRTVRRLEIQAANDAIKKSLRESKGRRAEAKAKGRAYKARQGTPRTGGR